MWEKSIIKQQRSHNLGNNIYWFVKLYQKRMKTIFFGLKNPLHIISKKTLLTSKKKLPPNDWKKKHLQVVFKALKDQKTENDHYRNWKAKESNPLFPFTVKAPNQAIDTPLMWNIIFMMEMTFSLYVTKITRTS
jgi:hypothetical protein